MKASFVVLVMVFGAAMMALAWWILKETPYQAFTTSLERQLEREARFIVADLNAAAEEGVVQVQQLPGFQVAAVSKDIAALSSILSTDLKDMFPAHAGFKFVQMYVYDRRSNIVAWSTHGPSPKDRKSGICNQTVYKAHQQTRTSEDNMYSSFCAWSDRAYLSVVFPLRVEMGGGYLQFIIDPFPALMQIEQAMGMPLLIQSVDNKVNYRSAQWVSGKLPAHLHEVSTWLQDAEGVPVLQLLLQSDISVVQQGANKAFISLLLPAVLLTVVISALALMLLHKSVSLPLKELVNQFERVRENRHFLSTPMDKASVPEMNEVVHAYNRMSLELSCAYDEYEEAAFTDQLTALPNRALFLDRLKQMILLSKRNSEKFGVMLLDLDGFKEVNDTLGHQVGDQLLQQIAERLKSSIRASSTIARVVEKDGADAEHNPTLARLGGDEFALLLPDLPGVEGATSVARRIMEILEPHAEIDGNSIVVVGTLGIAMYPEHGEDAESLLRRSDVALYVAKHIHNDFSIYDPAYDTHSVKQLALKAELRMAIEGDQMVLFYQPKLNYKTGTITSVEALVRWQHPERGMIPPDQFIPLSEQRGLIGPLTEWVIEHALWQYNQWQREGYYFQIAVNLSSRVLYDLSLPNKIERLLVQSNVPPSALILEITEEATMIDPKRALDIMNRLRDLGLQLSIDDFGTGYSSLAYLKRLPVAEIKIDRSFVMDMEESENDAKIVHATIDLAHNLGLQVVAEGVETEECLNILKTLNCDYAQGYYLSRPVSADELIEWLDNTEWSA